MDGKQNKINCLICNKLFTNNNSYIGSHVKRIHNILLNDYVQKYYKNINIDFKKEKCGFCDNLAIPNMKINHIEKTYECNYDNGYLCGDDKCRNNISLMILNKPYDKSSYEHIGSKSNYLSMLYKIDINDAKNKKRNLNYKVKEKSKTNLNGYIKRYGEKEGLKRYNDRCDKISKTSKKDWYIEKYGEKEGSIKWEYKFRHNSSIDGFIKKYGEKEGLKRYNDRCNKIGKSNKLDWYIEKYGEKEGNKKWNNYINKIRNISKKRQSKSSLKIKKILEELKIKYIEEFQINDTQRFSDYYIEDYNTIIEFYGNYWHCNPLIFEKKFYHHYIKMSAEDIWEKDKKRIDDIYKNFNEKVNIIIIWESSVIDKDYLLKILIDNKEKNNIIYI